jgi:hypothetical protein
MLILTPAEQAAPAAEPASAAAHAKPDISLSGSQFGSGTSAGIVNLLGCLLNLHKRL